METRKRNFMVLALSLFTIIVLLMVLLTRQNKTDITGGSCEGTCVDVVPELLDAMSMQ